MTVLEIVLVSYTVYCWIVLLLFFYLSDKGVGVSKLVYPIVVALFILAVPTLIPMTIKQLYPKKEVK
jgi:hypothetical protein